jgi:hypothetical protein
MVTVKVMKGQVAHRALRDLTTLFDAPCARQKPANPALGPQLGHDPDCPPLRRSASESEGPGLCRVTRAKASTSRPRRGS